MNGTGGGGGHSEEDVRAELQRQPHLLLQLAENSLLVAESLRDNYLSNTARFVLQLRKSMDVAARRNVAEPLMRTYEVEGADWGSLRGEVVTFIDGGTGRVDVYSQSPILLRVGSYKVRTGERRLAERESFGFYPVILGDLEGGSKERRDFPDVVRIIAELLGGLAALERTPDLGVLLFHGPLVYAVSPYVGHTPFTEADIDLFLRHYAADTALAGEIKREFLREARLDIYPQMTDRSDEWADRPLFEPLAFIAYLYRRLVREARGRTPMPLIAGVVERPREREFAERVLLHNAFRRMRENNKLDWLAGVFGRTDLTSPKALLEKLAYTDALLLALLLRPGQYSEPWIMGKQRGGLADADVALPGEPGRSRVSYAVLQSPYTGFPRVKGYYLHVGETTEPVRIEVFEELGAAQVEETARRAYLYSRLLPGYGFPVGLHIVDQYAQVPQWLSQAYAKMIQHHLGVSLQRGEVSDPEIRRLLVQGIYMQRRDWLFRPRG